MSPIQKKVCLLGDFAVGKTSLVRRFVEGRFDDRYISTIGVKISRKRVALGERRLNLLVWDLAREDDFGRLRVNYLRGAAGALIVCDLTRPETFDMLSFYTEHLRELNPHTSLVFAANKVDLVNDPSLAALTEISEAASVPYLLTSAKSGENVEEAFLALARQLERYL